MSKIKELPKSSSHLLSCTQIITSIHSVVKELIENALDSASKTVEIKLEDYGLDKIEVRDSGTGINKNDINIVCKPHCTSKINSHLDLNQISTYGFRGEALAALCAVAEISITTKTISEEFGFVYTFAQNGDVASKKPYPCTQGTTVTVSNLFKFIPVRKQYYRTDKNKKEELKKIEDILFAFGCIHTDIRFVLFHNRSLIWQKPAVSNVREGLTAIFGCNIVEQMQNLEFFDEKTQVTLQAFLPKNNATLICGHSSVNRSIVSINKRPVRMKIIDKILKEYFGKSSSNGSKTRYPICYVSIEVPLSEIDVNIEPNKTSVILHNMDEVIEHFTNVLKRIYDSNSNDEVNSTLEEAEVNYQLDKNNVRQPASISPMKNSDIHIISTPKKQLSSNTNVVKSKENSCEKKKLLNKSNLQVPSSKRMKTTGSAAASNDLYRHIKTMDSFFSSASSSKVAFANSNQDILPSKGNDLLLTEIPQCVTAQRENSVVSHSQSSIDKDVLTITKIPSISVTPEHSVSTISSNNIKTVDPSCMAKSVDLMSVETDDQNLFTSLNNCDVPKNVHGLFEHNFNTKESGINSLSHERNLDTLFEIPTEKIVPQLNRSTLNNQKTTLVSDNNLQFETAKSLLEKDKDVMLRNENKRSPRENLENLHSINPEQNNFSENVNLINKRCIQDWSRGKHQTEDLNPITILKPSIAQNICSTVEGCTEILKDNTAVGKKLVESPQNQRKMTGFDFFCRKHRLEVASLNPEMNNHQIAQILTGKWNSLSVEEKAVFKSMVDKDYPKNVKKKERLSRVVSQNLSKIKEVSANRKLKIKKKHFQKVIQFDLKMIDDFNHFNSSNENSDEINILNSVAPGIWVISQKNKLYFLNTFRLQELIIFHRLLETYKFEPEPLQFPCIVSNSSLGEEAFEFIAQIYNENDCLKRNILEEKIKANGFDINILSSKNELQIQVMGMTKYISFYGVLDLKEMLKLIKDKGLNATLSECRPGKVVLYLQSEAVRMARQCLPSKKVDDVEDLVKKMKSISVNCDVCLHSKPVLHEISELK